MKLSKKSRARQSAISRAIASGKSLGGLLAGVAATLFAGCTEKSPEVPMGDYPNPDPPPNAASERHGRGARMGKYLMEEPKKTNKANERKEVFATDGEVPVPPPEEPKAGGQKP